MKRMEDVHDTKETLDLFYKNWTPTQAGVMSRTPPTWASALGEVTYLRSSWNPLLCPLKMSQQGRNLLFFLPLANNDISSHDSIVFETVDF